MRQGLDVTPLGADSVVALAVRPAFLGGEVEDDVFTALGSIEQLHHTDPLAMRVADHLRSGPTPTEGDAHGNLLPNSWYFSSTIHSRNPFAPTGVGEQVQGRL